jgi:hypothetical protein
MVPAIGELREAVAHHDGRAGAGFVNSKLDGSDVTSSGSLMLR